jgi:glyoxylase-like metal-dependent hydrolase (beta-lactamase superfamily II)
VGAELSASELARLIGTPEEPVVLDVREPHEVAEWFITGAVNIPLGELVARLDQVPARRPLVTVCAKGNRSRLAAQMLEAAGFEVANLAGGMEAWGQVYDTAVLKVPGADIVQVRRRGKGCLSYLVGAHGEAYAVDPSLDSDVYLRAAAEFGWHIARVFDTHLHADHLSGARALAGLTRAPLHLNPADPFAFAFTPLSDGDCFTLPGGTTVSVAVLHTPGHTEGSTMFFVGGSAVLSGDTIFVDGVGRPDLSERAEEFARNLHGSLRERVLPLPDHVTVLPAHYGDSVAVVPGQPVGARLGDLRRTVDPLSMDAEAFVAWATARVSERPPNYVAIIQANMGIGNRGTGVPRELETGPNRCSA